MTNKIFKIFLYKGTKVLFNNHIINVYVLITVAHKKKKLKERNVE